MTYTIRYCKKCWEDLSPTMQKIQKEEAKKYSLLCMHEYEKLKEKINVKPKKKITYDYLSNLDKYKNKK